MPEMRLRADPAGGAYSAPQTPQLDLRGLLLREGEEKRGREGWEGGKGEEREGAGRGEVKGEGRGGKRSKEEGGRDA